MLVMLFKNNGQEINWDCEFRCDEDARGVSISCIALWE